MKLNASASETHTPAGTVCGKKRKKLSITTGIIPCTGLSGLTRQSHFDYVGVFNYFFCTGGRYGGRECYPEKKKGILWGLDRLQPQSHVEHRLTSMLVSGLFPTSGRCRWAVSAPQGGRVGWGEGVDFSARGSGARGLVGMAAGSRVATGAADCRAAGLVSCRL